MPENTKRMPQQQCKDSKFNQTAFLNICFAMQWDYYSLTSIQKCLQLSHSFCKAPPALKLRGNTSTASPVKRNPRGMRQRTESRRETISKYLELIIIRKGRGVKCRFQIYVPGILRMLVGHFNYEWVFLSHVHCKISCLILEQSFVRNDAVKTSITTHLAW